MMKSRGERGLVPDLHGKVSKFLPLSIELLKQYSEDV